MIDRLKKIYLLYDKVMASVTKACRPKCARCCTCNVTLTSLEARFMTFFLPSAQKKALYTKITKKFPAKRHIPGMTTNRFARLCMEGTDLPDKENDPIPVLMIPPEHRERVASVVKDLSDICTNL